MANSKTVTKAYVLSDGQVISQSYLDQYAIKESNKIPSDAFGESYRKNGLVEPLYNIEALAQLLEINTYHYRAVKTKARDIAGLGWDLIPSEDVDEPNQEQKERANEFLKNCHPTYTLSELLDMMMVDFEATGNGYLEVIRDDNGQIVGLEHIPSHTMRVHKSMNKYAHIRGNQHVWFKRFGFEKDVHKDTGELYPLGSLSKEERANEILHLKNYTSRSDYYGLPDIIPALPSILGDKELQEYNISFFDNHAIPAYAVTVTGAELDEETVKVIERFFKEDVKKKQHSTLVLAAKSSEDNLSYNQEPIKFEFHKLNTEIKDASFRTYRHDNRDEVLSAHGVPPYRAGIVVEGSLGGSTAKESTEIYKQSIIKPKQEILESRLNRFILQDGLGVTDWKIKFRELDTRDEDKEIERIEKLFNMGVYSPNMIREERGEERIDDPNLDRHFINGKPLDTSSEETRAIIESLKSLHRELIEIMTKNDQHDADVKEEKQRRKDGS